MVVDLINVISILDVARRLYQYLTNQSRSIRRDRREEVAGYFDRIALTLHDTASTLRRGGIPHGFCGRMEGYSDQLPDTIVDAIGMEMAEELSNKLRDAHAKERVAFDAKNTGRMIDGLDEAAGYFEASADSVRAAR